MAQHDNVLVATNEMAEVCTAACIKLQADFRTVHLHPLLTAMTATNPSIKDKSMRGFATLIANQMMSMAKAKNIGEPSKLLEVYKKVCADEILDVSDDDTLVSGVNTYIGWCEKYNFPLTSPAPDVLKAAMNGVPALKSNKDLQDRFIRIGMLVGKAAKSNQNIKNVKEILDEIMNV